MTGVDASALVKMTVKQLQTQLKKHKLETAGVKAVLLKRLQDHLGHVEEEKSTSHEEQDRNPEPTPSAIESLTPPVPSTPAAATEEATEQPGTSSTNASPAIAFDSVSSNATNGDTSAPVDDATVESSETLDGAVEMQDDETPERSLVEVPNATDPADEQAPVTVPTDEPESEAPVSVTTLRIDNFRRPFTLNAVKALVQEHGNFVENGFWMDAIKTHCYVSYASSEVATKTRESLQGKVWPPAIGIALSVDVSQETAMEVNDRGGNAPRTTSLKRKAESEAAPSDKASRRRAQASEPIDALFLKTETKPVLYYLPLTDEQVRQRKEHEQLPIDTGGRTKGPTSSRKRGGRRSKKARDGYRHVQRYDSRF